MSKYGNLKTEIDGIRFDSRHEAYRYAELKLMERTRLISDLRLQVPYVLIPPQRTKKGRYIREVRYVADFVYTQNGETVVEDAKGFRTKEYAIKWKLMLERFGIEIKEV